MSQRENLLYPKQTTKDDLAPTRLITKFSVQNATFYKILQKHWHLLTNDDKVSPFITTQPSIAYKKSSSLRDILVHSHLATTPWILPHGTFKCGFYKQCPFIQTSKEFLLPIKKWFKPRHFMNCATTVVYLINC